MSLNMGFHPKPHQGLSAPGPGPASAGPVLFRVLRTRNKKARVSYSLLIPVWFGHVVDKPINGKIGHCLLKPIWFGHVVDKPIQGSRGWPLARVQGRGAPAGSGRSPVQRLRRFRFEVTAHDTRSVLRHVGARYRHIAQRGRIGALGEELFDERFELRIVARRDGLPAAHHGFATRLFGAGFFGGTNQHDTMGKVFDAGSMQGGIVDGFSVGKNQRDWFLLSRRVRRVKHERNGIMRQSTFEPTNRIEDGLAIIGDGLKRQKGFVIAGFGGTPQNGLQRFG